MNYEDARKAIQDFISDNLTLIPLTKIAWDNVVYTPVAGSNWLRVSVQRIDSQAVSFGPSVVRRRFGIIFIQIFTVLNTGTLASDKILDKLASIFETQRLNNITFNSLSISDIGVDEHWNQANMSIPFYFQEITSSI